MARSCYRFLYRTCVAAAVVIHFAALACEVVHDVFTMDIRKVHK